MGCQKRIAEKITAKDGDYLLMVKGNQPSLLTAIETAFISSQDTDGIDRDGRAEQSHGRLVGQVASVLPAKGTVDPLDWPQCKTIGRIDALRVIDGQESNLERRYFISSRDLTATELASAVRAHWGIENGSVHDSRWFYPTECRSNVSGVSCPAQCSIKRRQPK